MNEVHASIVVNAPIDRVYRQSLRFEDLPSCIASAKEVQKLDADHFAMVFVHNGERREAVLEIILRIPERRVAWRLLTSGPPSDHFATGVVSLDSQSDGSTSVTLKMSSNFDEAVRGEVDKCLNNFKRLIEEGGSRK